MEAAAQMPSMVTRAAAQLATPAPSVKQVSLVTYRLQNYLKYLK